MELTDKEKEILINLLGGMNQYEMKAILCKKYNDIELEDVCTKLVNVYLKLNKNK